MITNPDDIDDAVILDWLNQEPGRWHSHFRPEADWPERDEPRFLLNAFPDRGAGVSEEALHAKLKSMLERGLIDGCDCGCRGDWRVLSLQERALTEFLDFHGRGNVDVTVERAERNGDAPDSLDYVLVFQPKPKVRLHIVFPISTPETPDE
jgi:hypothetical protein